MSDARSDARDRDMAKGRQINRRNKIISAADDAYAIVEHVATDGAEITDELVEAAKKIVNRVEGE